jgi:hypothetical protein
MCVLRMCTVYGVLFSPLRLKLSQIGWQFLSVVDTTVKSGAYETVWLNV